MSISYPSARCEKCGAALAADQAEGLCPACLLEIGLESSAPTIKVAPATEPDELKPTFAAGERIGRYKIIEPLGEGGFGAVYLAEQEEPVRRKVALKVIKLGMDTRQVVARFEAERQALALMDHPNIAKVLDGGATDNGRPYFVMELVRGVRITDYCDRHNLTTGERLELFRQVCGAIQHAHQKGIIHRDIKPSNILVTMQEGQPAPKVIDFGIAKATDQPLTDKTIHTGLHQFIGTPAYMSPEQAEMTGLDIDTRSDIYSLGVLLYELLTGQTPFDGKRLIQAGLNEIRRIIREEDPPRPSTRLSSLAAGEQTTVARRRQLEPPKLIHLMRGDLDWIVMKALEKDRTRRYDTANGLAQDIQRHLNNEPVVARPPSNLYRVQKLVRRNRVSVAAAAVVLLALVAGIAGTTWGMLRALHQKAEAERQARIAKHTTDFLTGMFESIDPATAKLRDITVREVLDEAAKTIGTAFPGEPQIERPIQKNMGEIYGKLGRDEQALLHAEAALRLAEATHGRNDHPDVADSLNEVAGCLGAVGRWAEALPKYEAAVAMSQRLHSGNSPELATSLNNLAACLEALGMFEDALTKSETALAMRQQLFAGDHPDVAQSLNGVASAQKALGRTQAALPNFEAAAAMWQRLHPGNHPDVAIGLNNVGSCLNALGRSVEALPKFEAALAMRQQLYPGDHPRVAEVSYNVALCLQDLARPAEALPKYQAASEMWQRLYHGDHPSVAVGLKSVGLCLRSLGRSAEALPLLESALAMRQRLFPGDHPDVAQALNNVGSCLQSLGRYQDAMTQFDAALAMRRRIYKGDHVFVAQGLNNVASCLKPLGRTPEALAKYQEAAAMYRNLIQAQPGNFALKADLSKLHQDVGDLQSNVGDAAAAVQGYLAGLAMVEAMLAADSSNGQAKKGRASLRLRLGLDEAEVVIREIAPAGQAQQLGLRPGDIVVVFGGQRITSTYQLGTLISRTNGIGRDLEVRRDGQALKVSVTEGKLGMTTADQNISPKAP